MKQLLFRSLTYSLTMCSDYVKARLNSPNQLQLMAFVLMYSASSWLFVYNNVFLDYQVPYISLNSLTFVATLALIVLFSSYLQDEYPRLAYWAHGVSKYYLILFSVRYVTSISITKTPNFLVDWYVADLDEMLFLPVTEVINWAAKYKLSNFFEVIYFLLIPQLMVTPILLLWFNRKRDLECLNASLVLMPFLAGAIYYFFPVSVPAAVYSGPYFNETQHYVYEAFQALQQYNIPPDDTYAFMGMPSCHVIWTAACALATRHVPILNIIWASLSLMIIVSTITTGWHFFIDVLMGGLVVTFCYSIAERAISTPSSPKCLP